MSTRLSRHLRILRQAGLVSERRLLGDGRVRLYVLEERPLRRGVLKPSQS